MGSHEKRFRIALSFAGERREFVARVADRLGEELGRERILYDRYYEAELARFNLDVYLPHLYHAESELIAVFLSAGYRNKDWCRLEWRAVRDLIKRRRGKRVMLLRFDNTTLPGLFSIDGYVSIGQRGPREIADLILQRLYGDTRVEAGPPAARQSRVERILAEGFPGLVRVKDAFGRAELPDRVFAIELLMQPVLLTRLPDDRVSMTVIRDGVTHAVISTEGKKSLCERFLDSAERVRRAHETDVATHHFLCGTDRRPSLGLGLDEWPLRWASGGVLSVIRREGDENRWTPFFFRDIRPLGWNLALGASERGDDLSNPWSFQLREFLEETLVLNDAPRPGIPVDFKRFYFEQVDVASQTRRAEVFAAEHLNLRLRKDHLVIRTQPSPVAQNHLYTHADFVRTRTELSVIHEGLHFPPRRNVLVCINVLELGIEVVKVLEFELKERDYVLDGEAYAFDSTSELVRMPVALISHRYLRETFGDGRCAISGRRIQASVKAPPIPPEDIRIFPFDAKRRLEIVRGQTGTEWEDRRYRGWLRRFGKFFFEGGEVTNRSAVPLFTPAAAKLLTYYFAGEPQLPV
jgi:hypothetical protein